MQAMNSRRQRLNGFSTVVVIAALLWIVFDAGCSRKAQPADATVPYQPTVPFKVEVVEVPNSAMPAVHSYASATADGKWLIIGGRIAGLHGFANSKDNFPRSSANTIAYVIDPGANKVLGSVDLTKALPPQLAGPLTATNPEFVQVDGDLFIVGGYGQSLESGDITTFGSIIKIDVSGLMTSIIKDTPLTNHITQIPALDNRLEVTGGGLEASDGVFYLIFGQDFTGFYSIENDDYNRAGGQFQKYTEKVRVFTLNPDLSIKTFNQIDGGYDPALPYHRRDLNAVDVIEADGKTPGATVYGGVFMAGQVAGHLPPIDITLSPTKPAVALRDGFKQGLNHYDCASLSIFDKASSSCFTTFFGGISQYHYDAKTNTLIQDQLDLAKGVDGLPFINSVSTIQRKPTPGTFAQFIQPVTLPGLLGTDAQILLSPALQTGSQRFANGVINLANIHKRTLVGHLVGGIESYGPYSSLVTTQPPTVASSRLFEIWITPGATKVTPMPSLPTSTTPYPQPK